MTAMGDTAERSLARPSSYAKIALVGLIVGAAHLVRAESPSDTAPASIQWQQLPPLPDDHGFAGAVAGQYRGTLVVAGGANFPDGRPWDGAQKQWHDRIFVLPPGGLRWELHKQRLPQPRGYAVSLSTPRGIAVIGGNHADGYLADAFLLRLDGGRFHFDPLPSLPHRLANAAGALAGDVIYMAGGLTAAHGRETSSAFYSLDLSEPTGKQQWRKRPAWPGRSRMLAAAGSVGGEFFLFGGVDFKQSSAGPPERVYLSDAYAYSPRNGWRRLADLPRSLAAAPSPAPALGNSHLMLLGGDDGSHAARVAELRDQHPGFSREALAYHTVTNTWISLRELPLAAVTTPTVTLGERIVVPSGEIRPGVRTTEVWAGAPTPRSAAFGTLNLAVLGAYPLVMLGIGVWTTRRTKDAEGFFRAGQRIPWWAAGLSIYATMLSSITFMAIPAKAYISNWWFILSQVSILVLAPVVIGVFLPFFRQLNLTSAYEYLELRFNLPIRLFGSATFIAFQIARTGIVLYLPALALATVSNLDTTACIAGMTALTIAVTFLGGMEAVIWTDVAQSLILLGAAALSLAVILLQLDGGFVENLTVAAEAGKFFPPISWGPEFAIESGWVLLLGTFFATLISYTSNQEVVQRFMTTRDEKEAARAIWTNAWLSLPSGMLFFAVGTALYLFYQQNPARLDPVMSRNDAIFPYFMVQELPAGLAGFVVAGIFAAAQPTSSLNSVATAVVTDFYQRLRGGTSPTERVRVGRVATVLTGVAGMAVAMTMERFPVESLWELFLNVLGLTTGILAGLFSLGILTKRANGAGAIAGVVISGGVMAALANYTQIHPMMFGCLAVVTCFVGGYLASLLLPATSRPLERLTIHTADVVGRADASRAHAGALSTAAVDGS
jgi:SSS family transporter